MSTGLSTLLLTELPTFLTPYISDISATCLFNASSQKPKKTGVFEIFFGT